MFTSISEKDEHESCSNIIDHDIIIEYNEICANETRTRPNLLKLSIADKIRLYFRFIAMTIISIIFSIGIIMSGCFMIINESKYNIEITSISMIGLVCMYTAVFIIICIIGYDCVFLKEHDDEDMDINNDEDEDDDHDQNLLCFACYFVFIILFSIGAGIIYNEADFYGFAPLCFIISIGLFCCIGIEISKVIKEYINFERIMSHFIRNNCSNQEITNYKIISLTYKYLK